MIRCPHVLNVYFCLRQKGVLSVVTVDREMLKQWMQKQTRCSVSSQPSHSRSFHNPVFKQFFTVFHNNRR